MLNSLAGNFWRLRDCCKGAVTVDFMVLLAGVIFLFFLVIELIYTGSDALVAQVTERMLSYADSIYN
jgi:hypothetical protein